MLGLGNSKTKSLRRYSSKLNPELAIHVLKLKRGHILESRRRGGRGRRRPNVGSRTKCCREVTPQGHC